MDHRLETEMGKVLKPKSSSELIPLEQHRKLKLQNDREEGLVIDVEAAQATMDSMLATIRDRVSATKSARPRPR